MIDWINVNDRLPDNSNEYFVKCLNFDGGFEEFKANYKTLYRCFDSEYGYKKESCYAYKDEGFNLQDEDGEFLGLKITHWLPITPPESEE